LPISSCTIEQIIGGSWSPASLKRLSFLASFCQIAGGGLPIYMQLEFTTGVVTTGSPLVSGGTVVEVMQSQRDIQRR